MYVNFDNFRPNFVDKNNDAIVSLCNRSRTRNIISLNLGILCHRKYFRKNGLKYIASSNINTNSLGLE